MNLLFDTNIILYLVRDKSSHALMDYLNPNEDSIYVSFVSIAEAQCIAFQNSWGASKTEILEDFFANSRIINITDLLLNTYIGIDAYSQCKHPDYKTYPFKTPRNMGKNDLWIAATASVLNLKLVTTDSDFDHLDSSFLSLQKVLPATLQPFFKR